MNESKITVRYAKALFALAKEDNALEAVGKDMEFLQQCIREVPELQYVIQSPVIKVSEKISLFTETFRDTFHKLTSSFINLLLEKRREDFLAGISRYFLTLMKTERGIKSAELVTASPLDEGLKQSILKYITEKFKMKVELHESVDESLIGGFILRVDDQQVDASIATKLSRIKTTLVNFQSC
jgi:F-type H+-transporting ATPase subunit delta